MKTSSNNFSAATALIFCLQATLLAVPAFSQSGSRSAAPAARPAAVQSFPAQSQSFPAAPRSVTRPAPPIVTRSTPTRPNTAQPEFQWRPTGQVGFDQFDHGAWDSLLQKYVDRNGNVDYPRWKTDSRDRSELTAYLRRMSNVGTSVRSSREAQMAFWINAYNALTIEGILELFPTTSIKNHAPEPGGFNIWDDFKLAVDGREYSLNDMEHKVLRKMGDPRIHFAIVCASRGCPTLSQRAYVPQLLDRQLTDNARVFFRSPDKLRLDPQRRHIAISPIIEWFGEDFGRNDSERLRYLSQFMPDETSAQLAASGLATVSYLDYDWSLNVAATSSQSTATTARRFDTVDLQRPADFQRPQCPQSAAQFSGR